MPYKVLLQQAFDCAFQGSTLDLPALARSFGADYVQHVNGQTLDRAQFVAHLQALRQSTRRIEIRFRQLIGTDNLLFSQHLAEVETLDGQRSVHQVHALFRFEHGLIVECDELTHMLSGAATSQDLAARLQP